MTDNGNSKYQIDKKNKFYQMKGKPLFSCTYKLLRF